MVSRGGEVQERRWKEVLLENSPAVKSGGAAVLFKHRERASASYGVAATA